MKASEIKTDGTEYAYQRNVHGLGYRVKVIEATIVTARTWHGSDQPGWLVEALDERGERDFGGPTKGKQFPVTSRQLVAPWDLFNAQAKAEREQQLAERAAEQAEQDRQQQAAKDVVAMLDNFGIDAPVRVDTSMRLSATSMLTLLEAVVGGVRAEYEDSNN